MHRKTLVSLACLFILSSCGTHVNVTYVVKSPNEDGGLEGNASGDTVSAYDTSKAEALLKTIGTNSYYTYEVTCRVSGNESHFVQYYSPSIFYELNDDHDESIGYASEKDTESLFKFRLSEDMSEIYPSVYEYMQSGGEYVKLTGLYSPISLTSFTLISELEDPDYSVIALSANKFQITDSDIASVFQYMTSYGSSITDYIISTYFEIIDESSGKFRATVNLGDYGTIVGEYNACTASEFPLKDIEKKIDDGEITGVEHYDDVYALFNDRLALNNYTLSGIKVAASTGGVTSPTYNVVCTEDYFYFDYLTDESYADFGYVYIEKNTEVTCRYDSEGNEKSTKYNLPYGACFEYEKIASGFEFTRLIGPLEYDWKYLEVDTLPDTGKSDTLYIISENGGKTAYQYTEITDGTYGFKEYSTWFASVADFAIDGLSASFYLSGNLLAEEAARFFERDLNDENRYSTENTDVMSFFANGLFGWGFQTSTTWMDYITDANLTINKDNEGNIESADIGLNVMASLNGSAYAKQRIYYTASGFGTSENADVESFLQGYLGE